ncbi:hypothetical protein PSAC2689_70141 [Paraburkholderia sacchari]
MSRFALRPKKGYNLEVAGRAAFICAPGATTWLSEKMGVSPIFFCPSDWMLLQHPGCSKSVVGAGSGLGRSSSWGSVQVGAEG